MQEPTTVILGFSRTGSQQHGETQSVALMPPKLARAISLCLYALEQHGSRLALCCPANMTEILLHCLATDSNALRVPNAGPYTLGHSYWQFSAFELLIY